MKRSPLHALHEELGGRFVLFGDWEMPVQYSSVLEEHMAVRSRHGWFDVSHLGRFSISGPGASRAVSSLLSNDAVALEPGKSQYTLMLDEHGGIVDDLIVWKWGEDDYWILPNAANHDFVLSAFRDEARDAGTEDLRPSTVSIAIQGPDAPQLIESILGFVPGRFRTAVGTYAGQPVWTAGTGYTGERGGEVVLPIESASELVADLVAQGSMPCGLAARDTLRLEAGLPLWGQDMDRSTTPLDAGLLFAVDFDHAFVGRDAVIAQQATGAHQVPVAFRTEGRQIPRHGMALRSGSVTGVVTSGNFSPVLGCGIGLGRMSQGFDEPVDVEIRGSWVPADVVRPPFHRLGSAS